MYSLRGFCYANKSTKNKWFDTISRGKMLIQKPQFRCVRWGDSPNQRKKWIG